MTEKDVYKNGVALLEEWEDVNYCEHSFKFKDEWLTDKEVVDKLNELNNENKSFKAEIEQLKKCYNNVLNEMDTLAEVNDKTFKENNELKVTNGEMEDYLARMEEENKELKKRDDLVSSYIRDEGSITLEKYDEIVDYLYKEWKKKRDLND